MAAKPTKVQCLECGFVFTIGSRIQLIPECPTCTSVDLERARITVQCLECGDLFTIVGRAHFAPKCPNCDSFDILHCIG